VILQPVLELLQPMPTETFEQKRGQCNHCTQYYIIAIIQSVFEQYKKELTNLHHITSVLLTFFITPI
jgi:hypothetical protein